jgi:hypothetical protein
MKPIKPLQTHLEAFFIHLNLGVLVDVRFFYLHVGAIFGEVLILSV